MDARTRNLAWILGACAVAMAVLLAVSSWSDENTRLDNELASLQKRARLAVSGTAPATETDRADLESRLRPLQELPSAVAFAAQVREALKRSGLVLEDFAVQDDGVKGGHVRVQMTGSMAQWFAFQVGLRRAGPVVYRSANFDSEQGRFHIMAVVGYAARP